MVKLILAAKGSGKTKTIIEMVNGAAAVAPGCVVCIAKGNELNLDISHSARLVDASDYNVDGAESLLGFVAGIHAGNYDITKIYIDGLYKMIKPQDADAFLDKLNAFAAKHNVNFTVTVSVEQENATETMKKYL
ncbi:MAG: hypothetical protein ACI4PQ_09015 [Butyricicoccaceae bacterium]